MYQKTKFIGIFKELFLEYIQYKQSLGYDYGYSVVNNLIKLNDYLISNNLATIKIPEVLFHKWIQLRDDEAVSTQQKRYAAIHGFSQFLIKQGHKNIYDSENIVYKKENYIPHIYTSEEINEILEIADTIKFSNNKCIYDHHKMLPIVLRLLYSTGMRISEVLNLKLKDIDKHTGAICIWDSKNHISRRIIASNSMQTVLVKYLNMISFNSTEDYLFHGKDYRKYSYGSVLSRFHQILTKSNCFENSNHLRIHDMRHTFSVRALEQMEDLGYDLYTSLPLLTKYLGHNSVNETEYYIRLTKDSHVRISSANEKYSPNLFPEMEVINNDK
jgi:integrase